MCVFVYVDIYVYVYVCECVCVCIYIYIYTYMVKQTRNLLIFWSSGLCKIVSLVYRSL